MKKRTLLIAMLAMLGTAAAAGNIAAQEIPENAVTATGTAQGIDGDVVVQVTADENTIYDVVVLEQNETPGIGSVAVEELPSAIVSENSILVDGITSATVTSNAIKEAAREALADDTARP